MQELKRTIADGDAALVLGTGVTHGDDRERARHELARPHRGRPDRVVGLGLRDKAWRGRALETLRHGALEDLIGVAQQVSLTAGSTAPTYVVATGPRHYHLCTDAEATVLREKTKPGDRVFPIVYGTSHPDLAPFVAAQLAHPTRIVPPELVGLATAYDGLTDAAYPGPERWTRKDEIFRLMRSHSLVEGVDLDVLEASGPRAFRSSP